MSTLSAPTAATENPTLTTRNKVGVGLAVLLGVADIAGLAVLNVTPEPGEAGPPDAVIVFGAVLGVVTIIAAILALRRRSRGGLRVAAATRLLSGVLALPAFFVENVPAPLVVASAVGLLVTLLTVTLLVSRR